MAFGINPYEQAERMREAQAFVNGMVPINTSTIRVDFGEITELIYFIGIFIVLAWTLYILFNSKKRFRKYIIAANTPLKRVGLISILITIAFLFSYFVYVDNKNKSIMFIEKYRITKLVKIKDIPKIPDNLIISNHNSSIKYLDKACLDKIKAKNNLIDNFVSNYKINYTYEDLNDSELNLEYKKINNCVIHLKHSEAVYNYIYEFSLDELLNNYFYYALLVLIVSLLSYFGFIDNFYNWIKYGHKKPL